MINVNNNVLTDYYVQNRGSKLVMTDFANLEKLARNIENTWLDRSQYILNVTIFPFNVKRLFQNQVNTYILSSIGGQSITGTYNNITVENVTGIKGAYFLGEYIFTGQNQYFINTLGIQKRTFLESSKYTSLDLYVPYFGFIKLDVDEICDKPLKVYMSVDLKTGMATCYLTLTVTGNNGNDIYEFLYKSVQGCVGISFDLTTNNLNRKKVASYLGLANSIGSVAHFSPSHITNRATSTNTNSMAFAKNFVNSRGTEKYSRLKRTSESGSAFIGGTKTDTFSAQKSIGSASFDPSQVMSSLGNIMLTSGDITHISSNGTDFNMLGQPTEMFVIISRPNVINNDYRLVKGYKCGKVLYLNQLSGFTIVNDIHLVGFPTALEEELEEIELLLKTGVYL